MHHEKGGLTSAKSIDPGQPAQSAQSDLGRNFSLLAKFLDVQGLVCLVTKLVGEKVAITDSKICDGLLGTLTGDNNNNNNIIIMMMIIIITLFKEDNMLRHHAFFQHGLLVINLSLQITFKSYIHTNAHHNQTPHDSHSHSFVQKKKKYELKKTVKHTTESVY